MRNMAGSKIAFCEDGFCICKLDSSFCKFQSLTWKDNKVRSEKGAKERCEPESDFLSIGIVRTTRLAAAALRLFALKAVSINLVPIKKDCPILK
jgi:hypothetical protein